MDDYLTRLKALAARYNAGEMSQDKYYAAIENESRREWSESHADEIKASGRRTKLCNICRVNRVPAMVHACHQCD